ncbi:centrosomal protein of 95 kDa isoform X7 [Molossus molossus]|uniref:centrosomal protein of 95 kDa isoform X7 n=1 Tax=Molossus molossus TaxID=27622 RepID=UPI001746D150|nr:centrosomal protein of 95 kDa isoform X7 [Molossus molossus]
MAGSEAEWVTVANNLLLKCHIHLRIHDLEDCDANVFIALYQSILGEKVPDLIANPRSQEDEAHNAQAVIDSLALDYLQVSLSHITGENIMKGDKESIKNLLEIFDGLLEYLTEHISETSHEKSETGQGFKESHGEEPLEESESTKESRSSWKRVSFRRCSLSSETLGPSWDGDEAESTGEIIRLGDTAHTFSLRSNGTQGPNKMQSEQASTVPCFKSREEVLNPPSSSFLSKSGTSFVEDTEIPPVDMIPSARKLGEPIRSAIPLHPPYHPSEPRASCPIGKEYLRSSHCSPAMNSSGEGTAFSLEPDNRVFLTSKMLKDSKQETYPAQVQGPRTRKFPKGKRYENRAAVSSWDSPFSQRPKNRLTEQELHEVSEKLSKRLSELDWMLKSALGDRIKEKTHHEEDTGNEEMESGNYETLSQHSDSIMECGQKKQRPGLAMHRKPPYRSHSLSPSPVNKNKQFNMERKKQGKPIETDTRRFQAKQDFKDRIHRQKLTQSKIRENRQQIVRARKYYDDYRVQLRAKMMRMRTREEMIFKKLFEEGLQIQKQRLRDLRNYAKEKRDEQKRQHQNELDSMENYYKDQFSLLAEAISQEHQELKAREKSQAQTLYKVKRELRSKMEKEIQQLQYMITQNDDDAFFRELEAERFKSRLHLASFQYSKNPFP